MKRFLAFVFALILVFSVAVPAFADDEEAIIDADRADIPSSFDAFVQSYERNLANYNQALGGMQNEIDDLSDEVASLSDQVSAMEDQISNTSEVPEVEPQSESEPELDVSPDLGPDLDGYTLESINLVTAVNPVTSATGLKGVLLDFIGDYDAIIVEYRYTNGTNYQFLREIQPDYVWLCSCGFLVVVVYCIFKAGGGLICNL